MITILKRAFICNLWRSRLPLLLCGTLAAGCGGPSDQPDLGTVSGTVTLDSEPLDGAMLMFQPEGGRPSIGMTDEDGYYELRYTSDTPGAKVGKQVVSISTYQPPLEENQEPTPERVPVQYNRDARDNPAMTVEVAAGGNTFDWKLTSEGEIYEPVENEE